MVIEWIGRTTSDLSERPLALAAGGFLAWVARGRVNPSVVIVGEDEGLGARGQTWLSSRVTTIRPRRYSFAQWPSLNSNRISFR